MSISTTILIDLQNKIEELETSALAFRDEIKRELMLVAEPTCFGELLVLTPLSHPPSTR